MWINENRFTFFIFSVDYLFNRQSSLYVIICCENVKYELHNTFYCRKFLVYETICLSLHKNEHVWHKISSVLS